MEANSQTVRRNTRVLPVVGECIGHIVLLYLTSFTWAILFALRLSTYNFPQPPTLLSSLWRPSYYFRWIGAHSKEREKHVTFFLPLRGLHGWPCFDQH